MKTNSRRLVPMVLAAVFFVAGIVTSAAAIAAARAFLVTDAEISDKSASATGDVSILDDNKLGSQVTFENVGDYIEYSLTVKNVSTRSLTLNSITDDNENTNLLISYDNVAGKTLAADEELTIKVLATFQTNISSTAERSQDITLILSLNYSEAAPNTLDDILIYGGIFVAAIAGLIFAILLFKGGKKSQKLLGVLVAVVAVASAIVLPTFAATSKEEIEFITNFNFLSKLVVSYNDGFEDKTKDVDRGGPINIEDPEVLGYNFEGWEDENGDDYDPSTPVTEDIVIRPKLTPISYTIAFDGNNATSGQMDPIQATYDVEVTLPASLFARTGYDTQNGWKNGSETIANLAAVKNLATENGATVTLKANWVPNTYNVVFHQNSDGVTGNMSSQVFTYDEAKNLTQNAFIKNHYKFMGWTTVANGTGTKYDDQASIFNLTTVDGTTIDLYAQWKERTAYLKGTVNNSWGSAGDMIRSLPGYSAATSFNHYEGEPNFDEIETKYNMAISSSNFPVYTWIDGETIYWWSEAETIYAHEDSRNFFSGLKKAETIDYSGFNFSLTKNLAGFFRNTAALSTIDLSPLAAANPTTLEEMFYGSGIASVDLSPLNTTQTINIKGMFNSTTALETVNLSAINTANVTDMSYLFSNSTNLKSVDFSHNNLSSVEDMNHMFYGDKKLESLNFAGVNTPNLKKMSWMFGGAKIASLDLSDLDTENVTHFDELFYYADVANLDISGFDTHNAATFGSMFTAFNAHGQVLDLSHFDTTSLNGSMYEMFSGTNASVIDLSSFDISAERAANIGMANILHISNNVETIYATEKLHLHDYSSVTDTNLGVPADYGGQSKLVGGAGTPLRQLTLLGLSEYDKARIDDPCNGKPGMFAVKNAQYICYNANIPSGETGAGAQAGEYLTVGTNHLKDDAFTRQGYTFLGWATSANGDIVYASGDEITITEESKTPLELYAQWGDGGSAVTPTFYNITGMQQMTADICATATTPNTNASLFDTTGENAGDKSYIPRRELIDNRDGKSYQVTKLADGKCWMTENLAIGNTNSTMTLTPDDSDVTSNFTLPQSNIAAFAGDADVDAVYVDNTFGGYYSSRVARAGYAEAGGSSICPKGWRLPDATVSNPRDWEILKSKYDISSVNILYSEPFNFTHSRYVSNGAIKYNSSWLDTYYVGPSTTSNSFNSLGVTISDNYAGTTRITGGEGGSIRCVAR